MSDLLGMSRPGKRHTLLLSLLQQTRSNCRDELIEMLLRRVRKTQAAAKEKLKTLQDKHREMEEGLIAVFGRVLETAKEQGNDFTTSLMYTRGVTCFSCHDPHGSDNDAMLRQPASSICLACHGPNTQNGPHAATIEQHTHHAAGSTGSQCIACHMPKIEQTIGMSVVIPSTSSIRRGPTA